VIDLVAIAGVALLWSFLNGAVSPANLLVGALLGLLLLSVIERGEERSFVRRLAALLRFVLRFLVELLVTNVNLALLAFRPRPRFHPHIVAVELRLETDAALSILSAAITLLPGTVAMGFSSDRRLLYAHTMGVADPETARAGVHRIETLILGFMR
jgi:multicomponent Na+:H+ antiporter subunit E